MYTQIAYRRVAYPCHDHRGPIAKTTTRVGLVDCVTTRQTRWSCQTRWACRLRLNECLIDKLQGIACATDGADNRETIKTQQAFCEYVATLHSYGHELNAKHKPCHVIIPAEVNWLNRQARKLLGHMVQA